MIDGNGLSDAPRSRDAFPLAPSKHRVDRSTVIAALNVTTTVSRSAELAGGPIMMLGLWPVPSGAGMTAGVHVHVSFRS